MSQKLIRTINPEVKIISAEEGIVDYIASNETTDSYSEIVSAKGWRFSRFKKNAPFVDSHNYYSIENLLGKVESFAVTGKNLVERVRWAKNVEENTLAKLGWKMTEGGFLKAVSVGFIPTRYVRNGGEGWNDALKSIGLKPEEGEAIRYIYLEQEQIELSSCIIGANPDALAKSYSEGCVKDADLASVGFADEDMEFLKAAGCALERPDIDPLTRSLVAREIGRITGRSKHSQEKQHDENTNLPGKRAGGEEDERRAFGRKQFLRSLADITEH